MAVITSAMRGVPVTVQSAATTGSGTVIAIPNSFTEHIFTINGSSGVAAGAIQIETADDPGYSGTWAPVGSAITIQASKEIASNISGIYPFLRANISTPVVTGTVTVQYKGN